MNALDNWIEQLFKCKKLTLKEVKLLCNKATEIFIEENNVVEIDGPVIVCGDIHGQFNDLITLFRKGGDIPNKKYLFLGDYVDRGENSLETISLLVALKVRYPNAITIIRGNHESRRLTNVYGFYDECMQKYNNSYAWNYFTKLFDFFPITALINNEIIGMHGGLSPFLNTIDKIRLVNRVNEPHHKQFCDLLWSDPNKKANGWQMSPRGEGFLFGENVSSEFLETNALRFITRAHQVKMHGYEWCHSQKVVTIFSASNYCNHVTNKAAILKVNSTASLKFIQYKANDEIKAKKDNNDKKVKQTKRSK